LNLIIKVLALGLNQTGSASAVSATAWQINALALGACQKRFIL
jgi:hypothetical protein